MANEFPDAMPRPWTAEVGERLSLGGGDCWVIDSEIGSVAEMQCSIDRERDTAKLIVTAVNSYDALRAAAQSALGFMEGIVHKNLALKGYVKASAQQQIDQLRAALHPQPEETK